MPGMQVMKNKAMGITIAGFRRAVWHQIVIEIIRKEDVEFRWGKITILGHEIGYLLIR
jgi:hypothetical protein